MSSNNASKPSGSIANTSSKKKASKPQPSYTQWVQQDFFANCQQVAQVQVPSPSSGNSPTNQSIFVQQKGACFMSHWKITKPTAMRQKQPKPKQYVDSSPVNSPPTTVVPSSNVSTPKPTADIAVVHQN